MNIEANSSDPSSPTEANPSDATETSEAIGLVRDIEIGLRDKLPKDQQSEIIDIVREVVIRQSAFKGPQPPPELLAQYEQIAPGWANRLLEMGERQQLHRIECEKEAFALSREELDQNRLWIGYAKTGQIMGFVAFLLVAGIGVFSLYLGRDVIAAVCFGAFGLGIVGLFLKDRGRTANVKPD